MVRFGGIIRPLKTLDGMIAGGEHVPAETRNQSAEVGFRLLPLRRRHPMLTHPTIDQLIVPQLDGMADAFVELQAQDNAAILAHQNGWLCCSTARRQPATPSASRAGCAAPGCVYGQASIEDVDDPNPAPARQGAVPATRHRPLDHRAPRPARHRAVRHRQDVVLLALGNKAAETGTASTTPACYACSPISSSRTAMVASPCCSAPWSRPIS